MKHKRFPKETTIQFMRREENLYKNKIGKFCIVGETSNNGVSCMRPLIHGQIEIRMAV